MKKLGCAFVRGMGIDDIVMIACFIAIAIAAPYIWGPS